MVRRSSDPNSYLVTDDEGNVFRIINSKSITRYKRVYNICKDKDLFCDNIIDTKIRDDIEIFGDDVLVLQHERMPLTVLHREFPTDMYEDYTFWFLNFVDKISDCGLGLPDAHGGNATLYKGKFIFYDFGAIDSSGYVNAVSLRQIIEHVVFPLILMKKGKLKQAYRYLCNDWFITLSDIRGYLSDKEYYAIQKIYEKIIFVHDKASSKAVTDDIRRFIQSIKDDNTDTEWAFYEHYEWDYSDKPKKWSIKMKNAEELLSSINFDSITDLAGNKGWYGAHFNNQVRYVADIDTDQSALNFLWHEVKAKKLKNVYPVYMSITSPTPSFAMGGGIVDDRIIKPKRENGFVRFKSDLVIALAIVHHLAFRLCLTFEEIINVFRSYTNRYLLVEFVDKDDRFILDWIKEGFDWYTKENFELVLKKSFKIMDTKSSSLDGTRTLYLCEKNC